MTMDAMAREVRSAACGVAAILALAAGAAPASAQTLEQALTAAYESNPTLAAQLAQLRATNEQVAQALAGYRPTIIATGDAGVEYRSIDLDSGSSSSDTIDPASIGISVSQPLYRGGRTSAGVRSADFAIESGRATYTAVEQRVLLDSVTAYTNVVRDQALLQLERNNEQVLERQLQATRDRFSVGDVTRTDVSQAESRLAGANASRVAAAGTLEISRATYARVIGSRPGSLTVPAPPGGLPVSLEETVALAESNNPSAIAAQFAERSAEAGIDVVFGELLPEVNLVGRVRSSYDPSASIDQSDSASLTAEVTVPLYQAGGVSSRVREARHSANESRIRSEETRRDVIEAAIAGWEALATARATIDSLRTQVNAARIALDGTEQEALVGTRTVLDVLDAEQELLDAQVSLVRAQRDEVVAGYQVLSAVGALTARDLGLPVGYYEFDRDYDAARGSFWGTSIDGD